MRAIDIPKKELRTMYSEEFLSLKDIAEYFDCSKSTIQKKMIKFNIPRRDIHELIRNRSQVPCSECGKLKPSGKYSICKDCWAKENGREQWSSGRLVPPGYVRKKRKFEVCLNCKGWIAAWNESGYCKKCRELPKIRREIDNKFCMICEKSITSSSKSGLCLKHSMEARSVKTIFKRKEALVIFDNALSEIGCEGEKKQEAIRVFGNLLNRRFFLGCTGTGVRFLYKIR